VTLSQEELTPTTAGTPVRLTAVTAAETPPGEYKIIITANETIERSNFGSLPEHLTMSVRFLVMQLVSLGCCATIALGATDHSLGKAETRFLSLISLLSFESTIDDVRSVVPDLAELRDQGWGNTNSSFPV
jgi:hypothetical protein